jgi:hypothetical protein
MDANYQDLMEYGGTLPVIDTHEHLESEATRRKRKVDLFNTYLLHCASSDPNLCRDAHRGYGVPERRIG